MWLFLIVTSLALILDQLTKLAASHFLSEGNGVPILSNLFHLTLVHNQGIAFGFFNHHSSLLMIIITISVGVLIVFSLRSLGQDLYHQVVYGLIIGGALGNLIDRIRLGHVVDFLDFRIWPVFNFADTFITIGVFLFALSAFKGKSHAS